LPEDPASNSHAVLHSQQASTISDETAWRIAQECREIVQSCLREEEWGDADREFFRIISGGNSLEGS
jgi:hypothetical protein